MARRFGETVREAPRHGRLALLVLWTLFIWGHSLVPGDASSGESLAFLAVVEPLFRGLGITDVDLMHFLVRKAAHFGEYLVLGAIARSALLPHLHTTSWGLVPLVATWVLVPCADETIQLFVSDRVGSIRDVTIDMAGFAAGLALSALVARVLVWRHEKGGR